MNQIYDYAVIGGGLTGLLIAKTLSQETKSVLLLDGLEQPGGYNKSISFPTGSVSNGLRFLPVQSNSSKFLQFLETSLSESITAGPVENPPLTFEDGEFKTFLSFGETTPDFFKDISYFTHTQSYPFILRPEHWIERLSAQFLGTFLPRSVVTRFQVEGQEVKSLLVNGSKNIVAQNYVYCGPVKNLHPLLPGDSLSPRARQRLSKGMYGTAICLDLCHSQIQTESTAIQIFSSSSQEDREPCFGAFAAPTESSLPSSLQSSQWMTFVADDVTEDSEIVAQSLKKLKRLIKKAYPTAFEGLAMERIVIVPQLSGSGELKTKANLTLPEVDNLWVGSPTLNHSKNLWGSVAQAQMVLASLGFSSELEQSSELEAQN